MLVSIGLVALSARQAPTPNPMSMRHGMPMSDADMQRMVDQHFASSPAHGSSANAVPAATFRVLNYQFDADNNLANGPDVVHIQAGQSVLFQWVNGLHTSTSGDIGDPNTGAIWDFPVDGSHQQTQVAFPTPGTYPFQCLIHGFDFGMVGTVVVDGATPTKPSTWGKLKSKYR
jgi:plastocyanin